MALPAVLLKAKGAIKKGAAAYNVAKQAKNTDGEEAISSLFNKFKLPLMIGGFLFVVAIFFLMVIVATPFILADSAFGGNGDNGTAIVEVEGPIEPLVGGLPIPHYLQTDQRWANTSYPFSSGGSSTIARSACGPTSFAMIASYLTGNKYTPDQVLMDGKYHVSVGTSWNYFADAAQAFNCGNVKQTSNWNEVYEALGNKQPVIGSYNGKSLFTNGGHFIVLRGLASDGSILVNDPNDSDTKKFVNRHFTQAEMKQGGVQWWIFDKKQ